MQHSSSQNHQTGQDSRDQESYQVGPKIVKLEQEAEQKQNSSAAPHDS